MGRKKSKRSNEENQHLRLFARNLRRARKKKGYSQEEFALKGGR